MSSQIGSKQKNPALNAVMEGYRETRRQLSSPGRQCPPHCSTFAPRLILWWRQLAKHPVLFPLFLLQACVTRSGVGSPILHMTIKAMIVRTALATPVSSSRSHPCLGHMTSFSYHRRFDARSPSFLGCRFRSKIKYTVIDAPVVRYW